MQTTFNLAEHTITALITSTESEQDQTLTLNVDLAWGGTTTFHLSLPPPQINRLTQKRKREKDSERDGRENVKKSRTAVQLSAVSISSLPSEIMEVILLMLPMESFARAECVCRTWMALCSDRMWKKIFHQTFGSARFFDLSSWKAKAKACMPFIKNSCRATTACNAVLGLERVQHNFKLFEVDPLDWEAAQEEECHYDTGVQASAAVGNEEFFDMWFIGTKKSYHLRQIALAALSTGNVEFVKYFQKDNKEANGVYLPEVVQAGNHAALEWALDNLPENWCLRDALVNAIKRNYPLRIIKKMVEMLPQRKTKLHENQDLPERVLRYCVGNGNCPLLAYLLDTPILRFRDKDKLRYSMYDLLYCSRPHVIPEIFDIIYNHERFAEYKEDVDMVVLLDVCSEQYDWRRWSMSPDDAPDNNPLTKFFRKLLGLAEEREGRKKTLSRVLQSAVNHGCFALVKILVEAGADPDYRSKSLDGHPTACQLAAEGRSLEMISYLASKRKYGRAKKRKEKEKSID